MDAVERAEGSEWVTMERRLRAGGRDRKEVRGRE